MIAWEYYDLVYVHSAPNTYAFSILIPCHHRVLLDWPDSSWCCQTVCIQRIYTHTAHSQWHGLLQQNYCRVRGSLHLQWWLSPEWFGNKGVPEWWCMEWQYTSVLVRSRKPHKYTISILIVNKYLSQLLNYACNATNLQFSVPGMKPPSCQFEVESSRSK